VAEVQIVPGDDRAVILCDKSQMENMFQNVNPGLSRRFPLASAFTFEDFSDDELQQILNLKLKQQGFEATGQAKTVVKEMLSRARNRPNFGNAGEIDILLDAAKARHQTRLSKGETKSRKALEPLDFDENFDRAERAETNIQKLFEGTIGAEDVVAKLEGYQDTVRTMKLLEMDPKENIPFNFLFRGPPGTGKTTTAKKIGKVFYDMGFLSTTEVIECSASDLIGQYVGHTGPKVRQMLDKALGRVLFIDEAYRLCDGRFAKEAIDELVDAVTKDTYFKRMIIIMAGYEKDINRLMSVNSGLTSRFPEVINFRALCPTECFDLLCKVLQGQQKRLSAKGHKLDLSSLEAPTDAFKGKVVDWFTKLRVQDNWASARDVQTVAQGIFNKTFKGAQKGTPVAVQENVIDAELKAMFVEREGRSKNAESSTVPVQEAGYTDPLPTQNLPSQSLPQTRTATSTSPSVQIAPKDTNPPPSPAPEEPRNTQKDKIPEAGTHKDAQRDAGVSDEIWQQLQQDKAAELAREADYQALIRARDAAAEAARELVIKRLLTKEKEERKRQEEERRRHEAAREQIVKRLREEEERRKKQAEARKKLAAGGLCPMGYAWIAQGGGYRCAGGSHFVSDGQLGEL
jgi:Holliday junction resolvasome RuvABC ATP-dependent DNA helicase subunit